MTQLIEYIQEPQYTNFYKNYDKKLTKNILKRCVVDLFSSIVV